jgi:hypothetical protein
VETSPESVTVMENAAVLAGELPAADLTGPACELTWILRTTGGVFCGKYATETWSIEGNAFPALANSARHWI